MINKYMGGICLAALVCATPAMAQSVESEQADGPESEKTGGLDVIVVTAQKRSEDVQTVPIAIAAFSERDLQAQSGLDVSRLSQLTPNVNFDAGTFASGSSSVLAAFIRGIGQSDFAFNFDPGVGTYVDGVFLARSVGANQNLFDIERVEVLKGPQGTLFGRNTIGGAVNVVTREPGYDFGGSLEVTAGEYSRFDVRGLIDIPITDNLRSGIAFSSLSRNGYMKRIPFPTGGAVIDPPIETRFRNSPDREGGQDQWTVRGKLLWEANDRLDLTLVGDYSKIDSSNNAISLLKVDTSDPFGLAAVYNTCISTPAFLLDQFGLGAVCGPRTEIGAPLAGVNVDADPTNDRLPWDDRFITGDKDTTFATGNNFQKLENWGFGLTANYELSPNLDLKSITAYRKLDWVSGIDMDGSPFEVFATENLIDQDQFSQELQLIGDAFGGRLRYVFGAYYLNESQQAFDTTSIAMSLLQVRAVSKQKTDAYAAFVNASLDLTDQLTVHLGGRYSYDRKVIDASDQREVNALTYKFVPGCFPVNEACRVFLGFPDPNNPLSNAPAGIVSNSWEKFTPRVALDFKIDDSRMLYASYSKGFKSGGFTTRLTIPRLVVPSFDPETATTYEGGLKSEWLDRSVRFNLAGFYTDYNDLQLNFREGNEVVVRNAGNAEIYGFEAEAQILPSDNFYIAMGAGRLWASYKQVAPDTGLTLDSELPKVAKWQLTVSPTYTVPLGGEGELRFSTTYAYRSKLYNDTENTPELLRSPSDDLSVDVALKLNDQIEFRAGATNLLNDRYLQFGQNQPDAGLINGTYNRPREYYGSVRVDF